MNKEVEQKTPDYEYQSKYCKIENGVAVGLDMGKINQRQKEIDSLVSEIKRVNKLLRETHNPRTYKQNKTYLERLERKLRRCQSKN